MPGHHEVRFRGDSSEPGPQVNTLESGPQKSARLGSRWRRQRDLFSANAASGVMSDGTELQHNTHILYGSFSECFFCKYGVVYLLKLPH